MTQIAGVTSKLDGASRCELNPRICARSHRLIRLLKNNGQQTLLVTILGLVGLIGGVKSADPQFKQEPAENLRSYFIGAFQPNYSDLALAQHKKGNGWFRLTIE